MKAIKKTLLAFTAVVSAVCLTGCNKVEGLFSGKEIKFGACSVADPLTKTSYGTIVNGSPKRQMIDWEAGDIIRIACAQASTVEEGTKKYADYKTSAGARYGTTAESRSSLALANSNDKGLRWGSESDTHIFYGVYPSPSVNTSDELNTNGVLKGNIPSVQSCTDLTGTTSAWVSHPDMTNQYMVAKRTVAAGKQSYDNDEVFLYFTPITTAIEFEITNNMDDILTIQSIDIISANHNLSGTFTTSLSGLNEDGPTTTFPSLTSVSSTSKIADARFGSSGNGVSLAVGGKLTFTIFLLPQDDLDDLTFRINKTDGHYVQTKLAISETAFIEFDRCKKHFVKGLFVNDGAKWEVCYSPDVFPWDNKDSSQNLNDPGASELPNLISWDGGYSDDLLLKKPAEYLFKLSNASDEIKTFHAPPQNSSYDIPVISEKTDGSVTNKDHGWKVKSYKVSSGSSVDVANNTFTANGLLVKQDATGKKLTVMDKREPIDYGDHSHWTDNSSGNIWYSEDRSSTYTSSNPMDLSKYDFKTDAARTTMRTANCYIIRHAGTYTIPLVYGNAIDYVKVPANGVNADAYNPSGVTSGANVLKPFVNSAGNIISPFIENNRNDGGTSFQNTKRFVASSASILWQDNPSVNITAISVTKHSAGTGQCGTSNCGYIKFTVDPATIAQCNALIAVKDASGNILWSWHIWITNDLAIGSGAIPFVNSTSVTYNFFPGPCLGWIEPPFYEEKDDVVITLEQDESGKTLEVTVKQPAYHSWGNGTYYQFGRKDPMPDVKKSALPSYYQNNVNMSYANQQSIAESIKNPGRFGFGSDVQLGWCNSNYNNLWTGKTTSIGGYDQNSNMIKTVYDPSPVGYKVPASNAFTGFTIDGSNSSSSLNWNYDGTDISVRHGYYFTKSTNKVFFPAAGYYQAVSGSGLVLHGDISTDRADSQSNSADPNVGGYWSALPSSTGSGSNNGSRLYFTGTTVNPVNSTARCWGFSIRPVTEPGN